MRVIVKFTGALLIGICGILTVNATVSHQREVAFFAADMRLDHRVVGEAVAAMTRRVWQTEGKTAALQVPSRIDQGERQLQLAAIDPAVASTAWDAISFEDRQRLMAQVPVVVRDRDYQRTLVPVTGPEGALLVLSIQEPLTEVLAFSRASMWRSLGVTLGVVALCSGLALICGLIWVDRPIRALCERARRIGRGDLGANEPIEGNNEYSLLARELDAMRTALVQASADVATATEHRIEALEQLRHADRLATVGRLAAGVAHELGTPLNVVGETAKMIGRRELAGAELVEGAEVIVGQTQRMTVVIRQLLDFARPRTAVKAPTDLVQLCRRTAQFLENMAQRRGTNVQIVHGERPAMAEVDPAQVEQVLTNLVVNAIQASAAGSSVEVEIAPVTATPPAEHGGSAGRCYRIDVRDHGTGIDAEHLRRLFEPFFTTKGIGEGTGLGLSVSRGMVRENGGWIEVTSTPGRGSCFSVFLPTDGMEPNGR